MERYLTRPHIKEILGHEAIAEGTHKAWPIPSRMEELEATSGRVFFVGDAMGIADPMTGGIAQALQSGRLAASALTKAGPYDASKARSQYRLSLDKALSRDHQFAGQLQSLLTSPVATELAIKAANMYRWTRRNFARWLFEDYPRALILTPDRWKFGALSNDGAYQANERKISAEDADLLLIGESE